MDDYKFCPMCAGSLEWGDIDGRKRLFCPSCGWINYKNPLPVVACLVSNSRGEVLLIKRGVQPHKGVWALPGGFIELDETVEGAGKRELFEETGLTGEAGRLVGVKMQPSKMYGVVLITGMEFKVKSEALTVGDDAMDAKFFSPGDLPEVPFKSHGELIQKFISLVSSHC